MWGAAAANTVAGRGRWSDVRPRPSAGTGPRCTSSDLGLSRRLLLRHTVQRPESPDQIAGVYWHHFASREQCRERVERNAIVRIVEDGRQHRAIRDIKIGVAGGQPAAFEHDWTRHGNFDDFESPS